MLEWRASAFAKCSAAWASAAAQLMFFFGFLTFFVFGIAWMSGDRCESICRLDSLRRFQSMVWFEQHTIWMHDAHRQLRTKIVQGLVTCDGNKVIQVNGCACEHVEYTA